MLNDFIFFLALFYIFEFSYNEQLFCNKDAELQLKKKEQEEMTALRKCECSFKHVKL